MKSHLNLPFCELNAELHPLGEILGYIARILSMKQSPNFTTGLFVVQSFSTLLAPALFVASIYMCLGRVSIFMRSVFRVGEYSQGNNGWLIKREWTLYIFDATLMWVVLVILNIWHSSHVEALWKGGKYCEKGVKIVEIEMEELNVE